MNCKIAPSQARSASCAAPGSQLNTVLPQKKSMEEVQVEVQVEEE